MKRGDRVIVSPLHAGNPSARATIASETFWHYGEVCVWIFFDPRGERRRYPVDRLCPMSLIDLLGELA